MKNYQVTTPTDSVSNNGQRIQTEVKRDRTSLCRKKNLEDPKHKPRIISAGGSPTIKTIIKLRSKAASQNVSPEQAAAVVKDYILPLFQIKRETKHLKRRSEQYCNKSKQSELKDSGVISDFKLVQDLNNKLERMKEAYQLMESKLKQATQEKILYESDNKNLMDRLLNCESTNAFINFAHTQAIKKTNQESYSSSLMTKQFRKYKLLYEEEIARCKSLSKQLEGERAKSDNYLNIAVKLEYINTLLVMENDILGEKLKGLYSSFSEIIGGSNFKLIEEHTIVKEMFRKLNNRSHKIFDMASKLQDEKNGLEVTIGELSDITVGIQDRKDKLIKVLREKNTKLESEIKLIALERDSQRCELEELERKQSDLQEEHYKLRLKVKSYKATSNTFFQERYCKNCQKPYTEATNFNWSCKMHSSKFSDDIYWCCGQHGREAIGCIASKHVSTDEIDDEKKEEITENAVFCSSCRNPGHSLSECPRDPNMRSKYDPNEELIRINDYHTKKKKMNADSFFIQKKFMNMVINKIKHAELFSEIELDSEKNTIKEVFSDIAKYKKEFVLNVPETLVQVIEDFDVHA